MKAGSVQKRLHLLIKISPRKNDIAKHTASYNHAQHTASENQPMHNISFCSPRSMSFLCEKKASLLHFKTQAHRKSHQMISFFSFLQSRDDVVYKKVVLYFITVFKKTSRAHSLEREEIEEENGKLLQNWKMISIIIKEDEN